MAKVKPAGGFLLKELHWHLEQGAGTSGQWGLGFGSSCEMCAVVRPVGGISPGSVKAGKACMKLPTHLPFQGEGE